MTIRARWVLTPDGIRRDVLVAWDEDGRIVDLRAPNAEDGPIENVGILPGLTNAHVHLEASVMRDETVGGVGLPAWVVSVAEKMSGDDTDARVRTAAGALVDLGVALVCDISNAGRTGRWLREAGLQGVAQHELLGLSSDAVPRALRAAQRKASVSAGVVERVCPHAVYSTSPDVIVATGFAENGAPSSIHAAEDAAESEWTESGTGRFASLLTTFGVDSTGWEPPKCRPIAYLDGLGVLSDQLLVVHGVHLTADDRDRIARSGAVICLCPRSNQWIGGDLPDVAALVRWGIPFCIGTDGLGSVTDLDPLADVSVLASAFPDVSPRTWLDAVTHVGAQALGRPDMGRLALGLRPGLLAVDGDWLPGLPPPSRRWLCRPGVPT